MEFVEKSRDCHANTQNCKMLALMTKIKNPLTLNAHMRFVSSVIHAPVYQ